MTLQRNKDAQKKSLIRAKTIEGEYEALKNELSILIGSTGIQIKKIS